MVLYKEEEDKDGTNIDVCDDGVHGEFICVDDSLVGQTITTNNDERGSVKEENNRDHHVHVFKVRKSVDDLFVTGAIVFIG